ncbi:caveolin-3-like [Lingula anatina]|uniref:Caveolin n=1 Tax=Lingula anatina TaxID=7574 RepID=A0A1S3I469_LINAN|nr:caveolin-3-like [Lingula anatina]|eukprot:XP_013393028.1 caveolin-3-like [Lingula anatina]
MSDKKADEAANESSIPLTVGGEETKLEEPHQDVNIDLFDRDPNLLNDNCKVRFEDIIAEPDDSVYSFDKVWILSHKVFHGAKLWCYRIFSLVLGLPLACCWGVYFACLSFCNIWCWIPALKAYDIEMGCVRRAWSTYLGAIVAPCFEAVGKILSGIRVTHINQN